MEAIFSIIAMIVVFYLLSRIKQNKAEKEMDEIMQNSSIAGKTNSYSQMGAKDLCLSILSQLNCKCKLEEGYENRILFDYQGEHFIIDATNECYIIDIWDTWWAKISLEDIDEMARFRKALNTVNINSGTTIVYSINEEENAFILHSKRECLLVNSIPNIEDYMRAMLDDFFRVKENLRMEADKLKIPVTT